MVELGGGAWRSTPQSMVLAILLAMEDEEDLPPAAGHDLHGPLVEDGDAAVPGGDHAAHVSFDFKIYENLYGITVTEEDVDKAVKEWNNMTMAAKRRSEVRMKDLTVSEKKEMRDAILKEWQAWLEVPAVRVVKRGRVPKGARVYRSRVRLTGGRFRRQSSNKDQSRGDSGTPVSRVNRAGAALFQPMIQFI